MLLADPSVTPIPDNGTLSPEAQIELEVACVIFLMEGRTAEHLADLISPDFIVLDDQFT